MISDTKSVDAPSVAPPAYEQAGAADIPRPAVLDPRCEKVGHDPKTIWKAYDYAVCLNPPMMYFHTKWMTRNAEVRCKHCDTQIRARAKGSCVSSKRKDKGAKEAEQEVSEEEEEVVKAV